ncbi:kynureninase [Caulobacter sp. NIBR1757]|uniref:kynureninase n=1 Tax=Caulobacter sp. NIBR1757 TaxID=3016000 RepID=UPI0022F0F08A|nr:kynureninase [Caulobacter sp. NIBR1757]WGM39043.1 Kynureninase [Caulobacter sp. NIBR1757]
MTDAEIAALDAADPLAALRHEFEIPDGLLYLDGNSLGPLTKSARLRMREVVEQEWGQSLIRGWNDHDWMGAPRRVGDAIAGLIGAEAGEVIVADSTSANLFKLAVAAMQARPDRKVVLSEPGDFPTDLYMLEGTVRTLGGGRRLELRPAEAIEAALDEDVAVLVLCHAHYKTARIRDMARLTAAAHAVGALVIWDLSHSAGVLEVDLNGCNADLAVGCGYKYLNGGPGAPAFLFVARRHQGSLISPLSGWMGHAAPFTFQDAYDPASGIGRFACGTPPVLGVSALECGVALSVRAGPKALRAKAAALTDLFVKRVEAGPAGAELRLVTPREAAARGGHVSFAHPDGYAIVQALIARGVIGDFRDPDIARFGFSPLTLSFAQVAQAADILGEVVAGGLYDRPEYRKRAAVT